MADGEQEPGQAGSITIDELAALNDEITALVRAGVPLDRGLLQAAGELPGGLKRITRAIGDRLKRGESLSQALEAERRSTPPLYRAVVEAGVQSGRLPAALEGLARYVRGYSEARSTIGVALWYPIVVLTLAYVLLLGIVVVVIPRFLAAFDTLGLKVPLPLHWLETLGELAPYWWPLWPVLLLLLLFGWWRSGQAASFQASSWSVLKLFPWMRAMLSDYESASFAELLALLLEHRVPYPRAVTLAAEATGNQATIRGARQLAAALERGEPAAKVVNGLPSRAFRPLLRWTLAAGSEQGTLVQSLHNLAPMYRKRGLFQAEKLQVFLPTLLMLAIGGSATLLYGLTLFVPLTTLLRGLAAP
ncbi:MAG: type II secretion system F family protein [Isosphaeraceae bacterium]